MTKHSLTTLQKCLRLFVLSSLALFCSVSIFLTSPTTISALQQGTTLDFGDQAIGKLPNVDADAANPNNYKDNFADLIGFILTVFMMVCGVALLIMFLWGGIEWITAGNDKGKLEKARGRITQGALGIFVLGATVALFGLIQQILNICIINFGPFSCRSTANVGIGTTTTGPGFATSIGGFLTTTLTVVMAVGALALFVMLLWGGISWIT